MDALDVLLRTIGGQAFKYVVNSGISLTSGYAVHQCSRLIKTVDDKEIHAKLKSLQKLLHNKVKILSPAIDLIEFKAGRGNVFLESAVPLAKSLHREIVRLGKRLNQAAIHEESVRPVPARRGKGHRTLISDTRRAELQIIIKDIRALLSRIDTDISHIQLAIVASGEKMNSVMSPGISPSRMMQASAFLNFGDLHFAGDPSRPVQIGPSFTLSLYMLFRGHSRTKPRPGAEAISPPSPDLSDEERDTIREEPYGLGEGDRKPIWQEVMHKARVRICRTPLDWTSEGTVGGASQQPQTPGHRMLTRADEFAYCVEIVEDYDDGRVHDDAYSRPHGSDHTPHAGMKESIPIYQLSKIFYTDTGRLLNIGNPGDGDNKSVLLLKRDVDAKSPIAVRQEWLEVSDDSADESDAESGSSTFNDQFDVDRQLREESGCHGQDAEVRKRPNAGQLPIHLDPEWLALEVYVEDEDEDLSQSEDEPEAEDEDGEGEDVSQTDGSSSRSSKPPPKALHMAKTKSSHNMLSTDANLVAQMRRISLQPAPPQDLAQPSAEVEQAKTEANEPSETRNPFGSVVTSLSLLEMLIRLTSLQEVQQTPHLAIPDHILTFFLDESSAAELPGDGHVAMRDEAKRRVGFDPYTDTP
ncbi:RanGTP-binding protein-domain-containing protein [Schizothecium vesticola]|uniref:RanGTP-binding protein-domain-containing protein n=1 Tax=Schizothecium vesticola TaxID=314040 RepID=A0AA40K285_9PEZI|nr:RanGTP-binding protein-domain-containing protein [Schizothecium vesticola]